jgi:hypothetical protein
MGCSETEKKRWGGIQKIFKKSIQKMIEKWGRKWGQKWGRKWGRKNEKKVKILHPKSQIRWGV